MKITISKSQWEKIGRQSGWMKKSQEQDNQDNIEELFKEYQGVRVNKPIYVSMYEVSRNYGGPEEGGWWYDAYELKSSKKFYDQEEAEKFEDALIHGIEAQGLNEEDLSSARGMDTYPDPSQGDPMYDHSDADIPRGFAGAPTNYTVYIEDFPGQNETKERPHYE